MINSRRISNEAKRYNRDLPPKISILSGGEPWSENNASSNELLAILDGPQGTPYEKYKLKMVISIPEFYPHHPPIVYFKPPIYHVNIDPVNGYPDLNILVCWAPSFGIIKVLTEVLELLKNPNPAHGVDQLICEEFINDRDSYNKKAEKSAKKSSND